ncbi:MAG: hypothetical protein PHP45_08030 [Elusimicrobiales bacterium]|nr:hypothetical protein [Elusimicrobiales bacterium]
MKLAALCILCLAVAAPFSPPPVCAQDDAAVSENAAPADAPAPAPKKKSKSKKSKKNKPKEPAQPKVPSEYFFKQSDTGPVTPVYHFDGKSGAPVTPKPKTKPAKPKKTKKNKKSKAKPKAPVLSKNLPPEALAAQAQAETGPSAMQEPSGAAAAKTGGLSAAPTRKATAEEIRLLEGKNAPGIPKEKKHASKAKKAKRKKAAKKLAKTAEPAAQSGIAVAVQQSTQPAAAPVKMPTVQPAQQPDANGAPINPGQ